MSTGLSVPTSLSRHNIFKIIFCISSMFGVILLSLVVVPILYFINLISVGSPELQKHRHLNDFLSDIMLDGTVLSVSLLVGAPLIVGVVVVGTQLLKVDNVGNYLGLNRFSAKSGLKALGAMVLLGLLVELIWMLTANNEPNPEMAALYTSCPLPFLLFLAMAGAAPLWEEVFFRGFMLKALSQTLVGVVGALLLSSLFFAVVHFQYGLMEMAQVFVLGLFMGVVRLKTDSVLLTIGLHGIWNAVSFVQLAHLADMVS